LEPLPIQNVTFSSILSIKYFLRIKKHKNIQLHQAEIIEIKSKGLTTSGITDGQGLFLLTKGFQ